MDSYHKYDDEDKDSINQHSSPINHNTNPINK